MWQLGGKCCPFFVWNSKISKFLQSHFSSPIPIKMKKKLPYRVQFVMDYQKMPFRSTNFITLHGLIDTHPHPIFWRSEISAKNIYSSHSLLLNLDNTGKALKSKVGASYSYSFLTACTLSSISLTNQFVCSKFMFKIEGLKVKCQHVTKY